MALRSVPAYPRTSWANVSVRTELRTRRRRSLAMWLRSVSPIATSEPCRTNPAPVCTILEADRPSAVDVSAVDVNHAGHCAEKQRVEERFPCVRGNFASTMPMRD